MKRVLIVSPHFPPVNAADMHRARMVLPFLRENGWEAEVLAVRRELSAEYRRRLDALEAEWATRANTRSTELEAAHSLKLQQVRHAG